GEQRPQDRGQGWAERVILGFWRRTREEAARRLWDRFLLGLTQDLRRIREGAARASADHPAQHWFRFRLALLRPIPPYVREDEAFGLVENRYLETLKLKFDDDQTLSVLALADRPARDLFGLIDARQKQLHPLAQDRFTRINFEGWPRAAGE